MNSRHDNAIVVGGRKPPDSLQEQDKDYNEMGFAAQGQLRSLGIKVAQAANGGLRFVIPKGIEANLKRVYKFSIEELTVGVEMPLSELARHVDEQSAMEARTGIVSEFTRHYLNQMRLDYDVWFNSVFYKCRQLLGDKPSDRVVTAYLIRKYGKEYRKWNSKLNDAEFTYRLVNNGIRAAWITKGRLLQTLRVILQGNAGKECGTVRVDD